MRNAMKAVLVAAAFGAAGFAAGCDQRLRRDAVPEVGRTADDVALHERHVGAERGRDARARVARGAATQDHDTRQPDESRGLADRSCDDRCRVT